jgi:AraC-like DNA-binding protein
MGARKTRRSTKSNMPPVLVDPSKERRIVDFRTLGFHDVIVLGRYDYSEAHAPLDFHCHGEMLEICYLESGQQTYIVGNERFDLKGGDLFVTFPNERHGSGKTPEGRGVLYWMLIRVPRRPRRFLSLSPAESQVIVQRLLTLPARHFSGAGAMHRVLRQVMTVFQLAEDPLRLVNLRNLLLRFLLDVLEASQQSRQRISAEILAVQERIVNSLDQPWPVEQLARLAHLSPSRFKARFKAEVGVPPADYVMRERINRAKSLLQQSGTSITETAMRLGFNTSQYFATVFKRYTGQTPSEYRNRID